MSGLLEGKSVLVTGAGSGIGRACAGAVAREGGSVTVADIKLADAEETVGTITNAGGKAVAVEVDVTDEKQVDAMVTAAEEAFGPLDCAFNNAGVARGRDWTPGTLTAQTSLQAWHDVLDVNLSGVFLCLRRELQSMEQRGTGTVLNTASVAGLIGLAGASPYTASKHGVVGLTKAAALEYATTGIRINALCPGYVATPMTASTKQGDDQRMARVPMARYGTVDEVAEMVVWLLSDRSSFCTGSSFTIGGGIEAG